MRLQCTSLVSVDTGDGVTIIDSSAFSRCTSLKRVTIGLSVKTINAYAFDRCSSLTEAYFDVTSGWKYVKPTPLVSEDIASSKLSYPSTAAGSLLGITNWTMARS